jgi:integrase
VKLTQPIVNGLTLPSGKTDAIFFDDDVPGFGLRLRAGGKRSWIFQYQIGTKQRRMSLGTVPALTLTAARKTAAELHARVKMAEDPAAAKRESQRRANDTVEAMLRLFLPDKKQTLRSSSYITLERHMLRYAKPLHGLGVALVSRRDIGSLLATISASSGGSTANRLRASLSAFFAWCIARGFTELNPVVGTHVAPEESRTRVLSMADLAAIWRACNDDVYGSCIKLLMLTGCRSAEIGDLRCDEIKGDMIVLPGTRTKNKRTHVVPLSAPAQAVLAAQQPKDGSFVFCGTRAFASWSRGKRELDARLAAAGTKLDHWTQHDLRRSVATGMAELGIAPHIVEAVLNHVSGHKAGIAGIYNRATYEKEKRTALATWADHVMAAVEKRASNVVPMRA